MEDFLLVLYGLLASFTSSLLASFAGGGSSLIIFPLLRLLSFGSYAAVLTVTKISASVLTIVASKIHFKRSKINLKLFTVIVIFEFIGTGIGTYLVQYQLNEWLYETILAFVLLGTAFYLFFSKGIGLGKEKIRPITKMILAQTAIYVLLINILNGLFGGTGMLLTIYLVLCLKLSFIHATAYTMISYVIVNFVQASYLMITETFSFYLAIGVTVGAFLGAWTGTHMQYLKGNLWVKRAATLVMFAIGMKVLLG